MRFRLIATTVALIVTAAAAGSGCARLYHGGPAGGAEAAPDSSSIRILVSNQNDETVRLLLTRGAYSSWIGTVAPMTSQAIIIAADVPGGGGGMTIRVLSVAGGEWDARGIVPRGGSTIQLDVERDLRGSSWSMR